MAMSYNAVTLVGRLTRDPEMKETKTGLSVCTFSLAVDRFAKTEERQTDFFNVSAFGNTADFVSRYLSKGRLVLVNGRIQINAVPQENGQTKYYTQIVAQQVVSLEGKRRIETDDVEDSYIPEPAQSGSDEIPF